MAISTTLMVQVPVEVRSFLERLAQQTERNLSDLVADALANYVALQQSQMSAIAETIADIDRGAPMVPHDKVMAWMESWGTPDELPPPE